MLLLSRGCWEWGGSVSGLRDIVAETGAMRVAESDSRPPKDGLSRFWEYG